jgi:hypothetical protein
MALIWVFISSIANGVYGYCILLRIGRSHLLYLYGHLHMEAYIRMARVGDMGGCIYR